MSWTKRPGDMIMMIIMCVTSKVIFSRWKNIFKTFQKLVTVFIKESERVFNFDK